MLKHLNSDDFNNEIINSKGYALVDFFATWCGPCRMLSPVLENLSNDKEINCKLSMYKLDIDESSSIAQMFNVMSVPTLIFFKDGKEIHRTTGFVPEEQLKNIIIDVTNK